MSFEIVGIQKPTYFLYGLFNFRPISFFRMSIIEERGNLIEIKGVRYSRQEEVGRFTEDVFRDFFEAQTPNCKRNSSQMENKMGTCFGVSEPHVLVSGVKD